MPADWKLREPPRDLTRRYVRDGRWTDETLGEVIAGGLRKHPQHRFKVRSRVRPYDGTFADVEDMARHVGGWLKAQGVGPGDAVAFQLPNWVEAAAVFYGVALAGAVVVPIVHFYGSKEVSFILRQSEARLLITADRFGSNDYIASLEEIRGDFPALETTVVVGGIHPPWAIPFSRLLEGDGIGEPVRVDPMSPALVAYTSGTTADPKGVVHVHRTILAEVRQLGAIQAVRPLSALIGAPVGHAIGMLQGLLLPLDPVEHSIHLIDVWDPGVVLAAMLEDNVTAGSGSTYFLTSLLDHPDFTPKHLELMPMVGLGGSPVPRAVAERADALGISLVRSYGSTEHISITGSRHDDPREVRLFTDGRPLPGVEIRLVDENGRDVAVGESGEILSRGPDCFMGYGDPALTASVFDANGWYSTEDIGVLDGMGALTITDRKKDVIIRGGENISAAEVEEIIVRLPGIAEVAVVAAPDPRLGEHACAIFRLLPGASPPTLEQMRTLLKDEGLAKQKWPEELRVIDEFPRTPSGKIRKVELRRQLRAEA